MEEMRNVVSEMRKKMNINDWASIHSLFSKMTKAAENAKKTLDGKYPRQYFKCLAELEDLAQSKGKEEAKKKMSASNYRSLNTMKQQLKKHNRQFEEQVKQARDEPERFEEDEQEEEEEAADESSATIDLEQLQERTHEHKPKVERQRERVMSLKEDEVSAETVDKKLREALLSRGRKGTDRQEMVEQLSHLATIAKNPPQRIETLLHLVSAQFDINPSMTTHMPVDAWKRCVSTVDELLQELEQSANVKLAESAASEDPAQGKSWLRGYDPKAEYTVAGGVVSHIERLDDEHFKSMQCTDPHSPEYMPRVRDEKELCKLFDAGISFCDRVGDSVGAARLALRQLEHVYYKPEKAFKALAREVGWPTEDGSLKLMQSWASRIYDAPAEREAGRRLRARATLCLVFHTALRGEFERAKEVMLMSKLQEESQLLDVPTQVLFNRAMAMLGLAAFTSGNFSDAAACLSELYSANRPRELLAQGQGPQRLQDKSAEQERMERRKQMPFHMHINLELVEAAHLICALLTEATSMAANSVGQRHGRASNRTFQRLLDNHERQAFAGPPESARDHIMAASLAVLRGDWQRAAGLLANVPALQLLSDPARVIELIKERVKRESLACFLLAGCRHYDSVSMGELSRQFSLTERQVHSIVSRMILDELLRASWDQPSGAVLLHHPLPSRLQVLATSFAEKLSTLAEANERAADIRSGSFEFSGSRLGHSSSLSAQSHEPSLFARSRFAAGGPSAAPPGASASGSRRPWSGSKAWSSRPKHQPQSARLAGHASQGMQRLEAGSLDRQPSSFPVENASPRAPRPADDRMTAM